MSSTLMWMQCGGCGGDTMSLLNAESPDFLVLGGETFIDSGADFVSAGIVEGNVIMCTYDNGWPGSPATNVFLAGVKAVTDLHTLSIYGVWSQATGAYNYRIVLPLDDPTIGSGPGYILAALLLSSTALERGFVEILITPKPDLNYYAKAWVFNLLGRSAASTTQGPVRAATTTDSGNPTGDGSLTILLNADDATIPIDCMAFQINRPTTNYDSVFALEVCLYSTATAEGPYAAQRSAHAARVHETGSGLAIVSQEATITLATGGPDRAGKIFLIFGSGDADLDGNVIKEWHSGYIVLTSPFQKSGTFNWAIIDRYYEAGTSESGNLWEHTFWFPDDFVNQSVYDAVWQTKPVPLIVGNLYANAFCRNKFGVEL